MFTLYGLQHYQIIQGRYIRIIGHPNKSGDIRPSLSYIVFKKNNYLVYDIFHRTIIPYKKVLQKGREQILFLH